MKAKVNKSGIQLLQGDITEQSTDAIVNAANAHLMLGEGVAGAIRRKGGPQIQAECDQIGGTPVGTAVITSGGHLKAKHVIHAVGPQMGEGDEDRKLREATLSSLRLADQKALRSLSFPAISTGIFGYPVGRCASIMLGTVVDYLRGPTGLHQVVFCLFSSDVLAVFQKELEGLAQNGFSIQK